ncbi:MAG: glycine cleavage system protein GcvH [Bacteroidales bacterium]|nr:glycine cleavage system protein GcvH [Bacteroidales bacterium]MCF8338221.1 glycine cleavage system protein GcvH [Bacteroidales bacterium]
MDIRDNLKYTDDHEWIKLEDDTAYIGITDYAQKELGDIVFIEVETEGETLDKGETFGTVEAVKTVSDMYMPLTGEVQEFNGELEDQPELVNKDPYGDGWIIKIKVSDKSEMDQLLDAEGYKKIVEGE